MQRPARPRRAISGRPFPTVSLFAIYCSHPVYALRADSASEPSTDGRDDDATREAAKVLFFSSSQAELSIERRARLMGTVFGMADFARMLSPRGAPAVKSVHSQRRRMVWLEVEPDYFIHATIELPRTPRHSRGISSATNSSSHSVNDPTPPLDDASLLAALSRAYRQYHLLHGSIASMIVRDGKSALVDTLQQFWAPWIASWNLATGEGGSFEQVIQALPRSAVATVSTTTQLAPLFAQFSASHSSAVPILFHGTSVLHLPVSTSHLESSPLPSSASDIDDKASSAPPPPLTKADLLALVDHLLGWTARKQASTCRPTSSTKPPISIVSNSKFAINAFPPAPIALVAGTKNGEASEMMAKWSSYYSLGNLTTPSLPAIPKPSLPSGLIPSMPALSMPSMPSITGLSSTPPTTSTAQLKGESSPSSSPSWGAFKNVGWGTIGLGSHRNKNKAASTATASASETASIAESSTLVTNEPADTTFTYETLADSIGTEAAQLDAAAPLNNTAEVVVEAFPTAPEILTPAVEVRPEVELSALAEAMGDFSIDGLDARAALIASVVGTPVEESEPVFEPTKLAQESVEEAIAPPEQPGVDAETKPVDQLESEVHIESSSQPEAMQLYCGSGNGSDDSPFEVRTFERGLLTLALATPPLEDRDTVEWLAIRSARLLEAIETIIDPHSPTPPPFSYRYLVKAGLLASSNHWPAKEDSWSGKATIEDHDMNGALFDCVRGAVNEPIVLESCARLASSQWVVSRRIEDATSMVKMDVYAVLPAKVGKDGSLVDAGEELRKLERAFPRGLIE